MFRIIDSNVFEAIELREIGLTYFSIIFGGCTFGTGITFADFHVSGIISSRNELLKIAVKGPARILAWFFSIQAGTLSGPVALFGNGDTTILNGLYETNDDKSPIIREEVEAALKCLKGGKSPGYDNIPAELIKNGGEAMISTLTIICNRIWETGE